MSLARVTVIDDDRDTRQMLRMALEAEGMEVGEVQSGLRLISTLHVDKPDIIFMEASLSWIDGIELCRSIKSNPAFREVPIIFISMRRRSEDIVAGLGAGAVDYFPKPLHLGRLIPRVREILASNRMPDEIVNAYEEKKIISNAVNEKSADKKPEFGRDKENNQTDIAAVHESAENEKIENLNKEKIIIKLKKDDGKLKKKLSCKKSRIKSGKKAAGTVSGKRAAKKTPKKTDKTGEKKK